LEYDLARAGGDLEVSLLFGNESIARFDAAAVTPDATPLCGRSSTSQRNNSAGTLNLLADENSGRTVEFALRLQLKAFSLWGEPILEVGFQGMPI